MFAVRRGDGVVGVARAFAFALDCFSPASLRGSRASAAFRVSPGAACLGSGGVFWRAAGGVAWRVFECGRELRLVAKGEKKALALGPREVNRRSRSLSVKP